MAEVRRYIKEDTNQSVIHMMAALILVAVVFVFFIVSYKENARAKVVDPRVWLGVETIELTNDVKLQYDLLASNGILVSRTFTGSPAQFAGIQDGDVIQRWNGVSITSQEQFQYLIQTTDPDRPVTFTVDRQGEKVLVRGKVGVRPGGI